MGKRAEGRNRVNRRKRFEKQKARAIRKRQRYLTAKAMAAQASEDRITESCYQRRRDERERRLMLAHATLIDVLSFPGTARFRPAIVKL